MRRTRIKFCGVTRPEDALAAADVGADAIGIIFHEKAGRHVSIDRAKEILSALPAFVTPVALFVDSSAEKVRQVAGRLGIRTVQLHGDETAETVAALAEFRVIKAIKAGTDLAARIKEWRKQRLANLAGFVIESPGPGSGGTGVENDWTLIETAQKAKAFGHVPLIAAGGLTPENVGNVVQKLHPWAVDVSSGVEGPKRGEKSQEKLKAFVDAVRKSDAG
jgi:phosphoribosylanthranilate isomerase